ncbi:arginine--tRNA ligase [Verminephrobacter aporrectodeae subsp. tuberculatae]|uniref:arginine--tRNA ligase n=1 Tax=Verminephrobacter aporrectodeae TaxID=1110389 RepID=UPI002244A464|nr:arginine--tRNA ligase [Verminephrobacter aporrectodeae]MCW8207001.1 arginine--tRNA ligase [Verminephrobacter aporrectodeae subsp. tuberculatae]
MLRAKNELLAALAAELEILSPGAGAKAAFESPKVAAHGDFACTAAMQLARPLERNPRELAESLRSALRGRPAFQRWVSDIDVAGPGFINIRLLPAARQEVVREVLAAGARYGCAPENGRQVLVEFVSANPTGPLHVGHGRQAALGDAISNLFATQGWKVHREFYYNDAGVQIETLTHSTRLRAKGFKPGDACWPTDPGDPASKAFYNGDYIQDIANDFRARKTVRADDREFTASGDVDDPEAIRQFAVAYLRNEQDKDLQAFHLRFDAYFLESSLYTGGHVEATVRRLVANGKTYARDGALWLRSTDYGDDKDRVMRKQDGTYTYFVSDVAYHIDKWERGYAKVVNIQGMDHHGTVARVRAGLQAAGAGIPQGYPDYVLHTMVRVLRGGAEVKISKRAGSYVTLRDLIEWTSKDAVRFLLLSRKPDTEYSFDVDLAVAQNNDNPVYYVQYAHARIRSVLRTWQESLAQPGGDAAATLRDADLSSLEAPQAQALMLHLAKYPEMLVAATEGTAPHDVAFYLRNLAASYHSYYDAQRILVDDETVKRARLALVAATAQVLHNGLAVLGVSAPDRM